jgi:hypothetical protein
MDIKSKIVLIISLTLMNIISYGQMIEGDYPFQLIDSMIFKNDNNLFQIDTTIKPNNFISTSESNYGLGLQVHKDKSDYYLKRIKEIHSETNNRDFIAGITNYSSDTILIPIQDNSVISILEAIDKNGFWRPIQFWPISGCGNSYYSESILPNQTLLITVKKDFGDFSTRMRLRLHGTDTILISQEFSGSIDKKMFKIKDNIVHDYKHILCDSIFYLESPRFGNLNFDGFEIIEYIEEE